MNPKTVTYRNSQGVMLLVPVEMIARKFALTIETDFTTAENAPAVFLRLGKG